MSRQNGLPTAPDGRREFDVASFSPATKAKAIRFSAIFCGMFVVLVWIPSAVRFYAGPSFRDPQIARKQQFEKLDLSGPVKPMSRTAIPGLLADLQENITNGHVLAHFNKPGDRSEQALVAWAQNAYGQPQLTHSTSSIVITGTMAYLTLKADGSIEKCQLVGDSVKNLGIEIDAGVWHTAICLSQRAIEFRTRIPDGDVSGAQDQLQGFPSYGSTGGFAWAEKARQACEAAA